MVRLIGLKKIKTAVFISGNGSNLKNLIEFSFLKKSPISVDFVVSNNSKAKGLNFNKKFWIKKKIYNYKIKNPENEILKNLKENKIELICLAGFMKILSKNFIRNFNGKILNVHPSLLPKYKGLNTHNKSIENKDKYSGCTIHYVNEKLDSGRIIIQKKVKILKGDTPKTLAKKILKEEHILYRKALIKLFV